MILHRNRWLYGMIAGIGLIWSLVAAGAGIAQSGGEIVFKLGVINERPAEPDFALAQFGKLVEYLATRLRPAGIRLVSLIIARDVPDMADKLAAREVDAIIDGIFPTLEIERRTGSRLQPALVVWRKGQREYHTVFFARKDGPVATLADLRGRVLVFETPRSTSAYAVPRAFLRQRGFALFPADQTALPADVVRYVFAGAEVNQAYWVLHGKGDAAAFNDGDWERLPSPLRDQLRIIAQTPPLLRWLLSFRSELGEETRTAVEAVLLGMHEDTAGREALQAAANIKQFERLTTADYDRLAEWRTVLVSNNGD